MRNPIGPRRDTFSNKWSSEVASYVWWFMSACSQFGGIVISIHLESLKDTEFLFFSHEPLSLKEISDTSFSQGVYSQY